MFDYLKKKAIEKRTNDDLLYEYVLDEIENKQMVRGLWAKALAHAEGNDAKVQSIYMKYRVQSIKDAFSILEITYNEYKKDKLFQYIKDNLFNAVEEKEKEPALKQEEKIIKKEIIEELTPELKLKQLVEEDGYSFLSSRVVRKNGTWDDYNIVSTDSKITLLSGSNIIKEYTL
jgi:hypothetical protein